MKSVAGVPAADYLCSKKSSAILCELTGGTERVSYSIIFQQNKKMPRNLYPGICRIIFWVLSADLR